MPISLNSKNSDGSTGAGVQGSNKIFAAKVNRGLIHQAVQAEMTNSRQGTQSTKTRGEVHHTTRKPYKQKGTGRARQGMTSAPHYRHGGIAMGPRPRLIVVDLPKKMKRAAINAALTAKQQSGAITVTDSVAFDTISTKAAVALMAKFGLTGKRTLVILPEHSAIVYKSFRNIPGVQVRFAPAFSTRDLIAAEMILLTQGALDKIESLWGGPSADESAEGAGEES